jgi:type III pantothenate kinase
MKVIIDRGNSITKVFIFDGNDLKDSLSVSSEEQLTEELLQTIMITNQNYDILVSDVSDDHLNWSNIIPGSNKIIHMHHNLKLPVTLQYKTCKTLGHDRIANVSGAWMLNPDKKSLVIDIGTCIKYDIVDEKGIYRGGAISPGLYMRYRALNTFTGLLPLVSPNSNTVPLTGDSTTGSILSGVENGIEFELNGFINNYQKHYNDIKVYVTGGDHEHFAPIFKSPIFVAPDLTAKGLNEILELNR